MVINTDKNMEWGVFDDKIFAEFLQIKIGKKIEETNHPFVVVSIPLFF
jgi:hypothetical protein